MKTGEPCLPDIEWTNTINIFQYIVQIHTLLMNPHISEYVNAPAADIFLNSPRLYNQMIQDCVVASRRIAGM